MKPIDPLKVQETITSLSGKKLYVHLETTNGAYATHKNASFFSAGAFIRNVQLTFLHGSIKGKGPYRIGLETELGWLYAEGLTDWEIDTLDRVLFAGHDQDGKLAIALQLSEQPFPK
ncbi:YojF family protein [Evansella sp. AB-P1]|uniref:YojF family protein n=1 Tax=Evansella sp. AB-P1 TaxID=3037653 RepID=UPI00241F2A91|nr:YojF family protein [Evansella sp. AB-P1]MDG5787413.1 YojF family protein [Evansella sp. AB-P1]